MAKQILVTGGAGFIGSNLVSSLLKGDCEVTVLDDLSNGKLKNLENIDIEFINGDIRNQDLVLKILSRRFDVIYHLAARGSVPRSISDPATTIDINFNGTLNILNAIKVHPAKLIFASSSSVYGKNQKNPKTEFDWAAPISPYAASKLSCESIVTAYSSSFDFPAMIARFFNVYGPKQRSDIEYPAVIPKWIKSLQKREPLVVNGDLEISRDFTYVADLSELLVRLSLENYPIENFPLVNFAFGKPIKLREIIDIFRSHFPNCEVELGPARTGDIKDSMNDASRLIELYKTINITPFEHGLAKTIYSMKEN